MAAGTVATAAGTVAMAAGTVAMADMDSIIIMVTIIIIMATIEAGEKNKNGIYESVKNQIIICMKKITTDWTKFYALNEK